jgi:hypothetical protein
VEQAYRQLQKERPVATAIGESAPYLAAGGVIGATGRTLGMAANIGRQARMAGALGLTMPGTPEERLKRGAFEAATAAGGEALGGVVSKAGGWGLKKSKDAVSGLTKRAEDLGFKVLPSVRAESPRLRQVVEGGLESTPGGAVAFDAVTAHNQENMGRIVAEAIGADDFRLVDGVTSEVIDSAYTNLGREFDRLMTPDIKVPVSDTLLGEILRISDERVAPLIVGPEDPVKRAIDRTLDFFEQFIDGDGIPADQLQAQISRLGYVARSAMVNNPELGRALFDIQDTLLDAVKGQMTKAQREALKTARHKYRNLSLLMEGHNVDPVTGAVNYRTLANTLQRKDKKGWARGKNDTDFYDAVRFMARVQPPLPSSGTAERSFARDLVKTAGLGAGGGLVVGGGLDPEAAGAGAGLSVASMLLAPNALARLYLSPAASQWMTRTPGAALTTSARMGGLGTTQLLGPEEPTYPEAEALAELERNRR